MQAQAQSLAKSAFAGLQPDLYDEPARNDPSILITVCDGLPDACGRGGGQRLAHLNLVTPSGCATRRRAIACLDLVVSTV
jgi:hypothetical protein